MVAIGWQVMVEDYVLLLQTLWCTRAEWKKVNARPTAILGFFGVWLVNFPDTVLDDNLLSMLP